LPKAYIVSVIKQRVEDGIYYIVFYLIKKKKRLPTEISTLKWHFYVFFIDFLAPKEFYIIRLSYLLNSNASLPKAYIVSVIKQIVKSTLTNTSKICSVH
jgi:hypothetical protein